MKINYTKLFLVNYLFLFILELIFKFFVFQTYDLGIVYIAILILPIAMLISFIMSLFKSPKVNRIFAIIIWLAISMARYCIGEYSLNMIISFSFIR